MYNIENDMRIENVEEKNEWNRRLETIWNITSVREKEQKNEIRGTKPNWETTHLNLTGVAATTATAFIPLM